MYSQDSSLLARLGIRSEARSFFAPYFSETYHSVVFLYGTETEHAGIDFHRIPMTTATWTAGEFMLARHVFICGSAMDAIAWFHFNTGKFADPFFISVGVSPSKSQLEQFIARGKQYHLLFSKDALGAVCDLQTAALIRRVTVKIFADDDFQVSFKSKNYRLAHLSLNALEKTTGYRFNISTHKPRQFNTFYEQLKYGYPH
jgi:hypothetical protein